MTTADTAAPFGYLRALSGQVGTRAQYLGVDDDTPEGEHGPDEDLRRAHDEHPCRCAHHRETGDQ